LPLVNRGLALAYGSYRPSGRRRRSQAHDPRLRSHSAEQADPFRPTVIDKDVGGGLRSGDGKFPLIARTPTPSLPTSLNLWDDATYFAKGELSPILPAARSSHAAVGADLTVQTISVLKLKSRLASCQHIEANWGEDETLPTRLKKQHQLCCRTLTITCADGC
jgi:hypothetical protein